MDSNNVALVRTELDEVFMPEFNKISMVSGYADCNTADIFKMESTDKQAEIFETFAGVGLFDNITEAQNVPQDDVLVGNKTVVPVLDFAKGIEIKKNFFDDDQHGVYTKMVKDFASKARKTRDSYAFSIFRNAWTTSLTPDGVSLINASHPLLKGGTQSNYIASALGNTSLDSAIQAIVTQKDEAGVVMGDYPSVLLTELSVHKYAIELTESALVADSGNNNVNFFRSKYGFKVYTSPYMSTAAGCPAGAWFLMTDSHSVTRLIRQGLETALTPWQNSRNRTFFYQANFRETVYAKSYIGVVGGKNQ